MRPNFGGSAKFGLNKNNKFGNYLLGELKIHLTGFKIYIFILTMKGGKKYQMKNV